MNNWEVMPYYMLHQVPYSGLGETFEVQHYVSVMLEFLAGGKRKSHTNEAVKNTFCFKFPGTIGQ